MLRTITKTLTQGAAEAYVEAEIKFPSRSRITILRMDIVVAGFVIVDTAQLQLGVAKGAVAAATLPTDNQCLWYKDYLQVGNQAGGLDMSWTIQNLPAFTNDKFTLWMDTNNTGLVNTAYFTLLVDIKPIRGI